jgi:nitroimidazol reductase NimA-like FMN-containing flavoprotein (pyridoxamine 5'-phosphate oxidase superfamily)
MQGELSEQEIDHLLSGEVFGHMGCCENNKPYVVPMAYVFHDQVIYGQTTEGKKVEMLRKNPLVCFQVEALHENRWSSVMCWGTFEEMDFEELQKPVAIEAVQLLTKTIASIQHQVGISIPYSFAEKAEPMIGNEKKSTLFRVVVHEKTGRFYIAE